MASYYVWSGATGSANGTTWANAYTTLVTAMTSKSAGDVFYVAHDHAETSGAANILLPNVGSNTNPCKVICANRSGSVPPVSADRRATASLTATGGSFSIWFQGNTHFDGIIFIAGTTFGGPNMLLAEGSNALWQRFDNCSLRLTSTSTSNFIRGGSVTNVGSYIELNNTTVSFANAAHKICVSSAIFRWRNTPSAILGTIPTTLIQPGLATGCSVECIGVDMSAVGSGNTIVGSTQSQGGSVSIIDCKFDAAVTLSAVQTGHGSAEIDFVRSGATGVNYTVRRHRMTGLLTEETTIVRTGGASNGTTTIAWKIITTANCSYSMPFECMPIAIWNDTVGSSKTATVEGIWGGGAVPNDDDIWLDVEYLGDASSPQGSFINDGKADLLASATGQTSSSGTWGGSTTKFKLNVTFTPQLKGWVYARVKCGKASSTFYVDPLVTLT